MSKAQKIPPDFKDAVLKMLTIPHLSHYRQDPSKLIHAFDMLLLSERHYAIHWVTGGDNRSQTWGVYRLRGKCSQFKMRQNVSAVREE